MEQLAFFTGVSERDRIMAAFQANHKTYLESLRAFARDIARRDGQVSIDEVRAECAVRDFPLPDDVGIDARVLGALFNTKEFMAVGQRPTRRSDRIARAGIGASYITVYALRGAA